MHLFCYIWWCFYQLMTHKELIKCVKESKQHTEPAVPAPVPNCNGQQDKFILLVFVTFIYQSNRTRVHLEFWKCGSRSTCLVTQMNRTNRAIAPIALQVCFNEMVQKKVTTAIGAPHKNECMISLYISILCRQRI